MLSVNVAICATGFAGRRPTEHEPSIDRHMRGQLTVRCPHEPGPPWTRRSRARLAALVDAAGAHAGQSLPLARVASGWLLAHAGQRDVPVHAVGSAHVVGLAGDLIRGADHEGDRAVAVVRARAVARRSLALALRDLERDPASGSMA